MLKRLRPWKRGAAWIRQTTETTSCSTALSSALRNSDILHTRAESSSSRSYLAVARAPPPNSLGSESGDPAGDLGAPARMACCDPKHRDYTKDYDAITQKVGEGPTPRAASLRDSSLEGRTYLFCNRVGGRAPAPSAMRHAMRRSTPPWRSASARTWAHGRAPAGHTCAHTHVTHTRAPACKRCRHVARASGCTDAVGPQTKMRAHVWRLLTAPLPPSHTVCCRMRRPGAHPLSLSRARAPSRCLAVSLPPS